MTIEFIPLAESHFPMLLRWLQVPHVKAWWDQDVQWTPDLIVEKYGQYVQGFKCLLREGKLVEKPIYAYIVSVGGTEIGYIQYYNAYDFPREGDELTGLPEKLAALDVFIGEPIFLGRGLGPLLMREFLERHVFKHFGAVFVDPDTENTWAIETYKKVGFRVAKRPGDGKVTWMVRGQ